MKFITIILIFLSFEGQAQVWHLKRTMQYDHASDLKEISFSEFISFQGGLNPEFGKILPLYSELIDWKAEHTDVKVEIVFPQYEVYSGKIPDEKAFGEITESLMCDYSIEYMQKKPFLQLSFVPFRKNPENGRLERLKSFVIRIESDGAVQQDVGIRKSATSFGNSVLSSDSWYKIKVPSSGIYKLTYEQINSMSVGNPAKVRIFGWAGDVVPEDCRKGEKDDLLPVQIYMNKGSDGVFNGGDYILFYSSGSVKWTYDFSSGMFRHQQNPYTDYSYYFVTTGEEVDLPLADIVPSGSANIFSNTFDYRSFHEKETYNALLSGKQWFGEAFANSTQQTFNFNIPGLATAQPVEILTQVMAKAITVSEFQLTHEGKNIASFFIQAANLSDYTSIFGFTSEKKAVINPSVNDISLKLKYNKPDVSAKAWLDYIIINARASLDLQSDLLEFRDINVSGPGNIAQFTLKSANTNTLVWDVSNQNQIRKITGVINGSDLIIKVTADSTREFIAFNENGTFPAPVLQGDDVGLVPNQNLHGPQQPDMVIISHPDFLEQAERLANYRREKSGLDVMLVTPEQVYNEFSSGAPDISAYRNFMKMLYTRAGSDSTLLPRYLLLFGDGTYDNKDISESNANFILTYQSDNSLSPTSSYVSDDFFALLDAGESMVTGLLDIGIGRLPAGNLEEAKILVDKILDYELPARMGDWRNTVCFIGDDEDSNIHMSDADAMANYVEANYPGFNINKIYLDAYKQVSTPVGQLYPDVNQAINDQVERGALIINYTGHGGIKGWAHELILGVNDIDRWKNYNRLPLFMTATCEFSRYDDHLIPSAGEKVLLNPNGGGVALFTTTRLVYSQPNRVLNEKFYEIVFEKDKEERNYRLGDIMKYTKNKAGSGINKRNFTLLGDPSQRLSYPEFMVHADSLNGKSLNEETDTLQALKKITVSGHVADIKGNIMSDFSGYVYPTVYDKVVLQETLANDGGSKKTFKLRNNILYKGKSSVQNGLFSFTFMVPRDINYSYGTGRLSFYAEDSLVDASGAYNDIIIGGTFAEAKADNEGPELEVYMNSPTFRSGGITDENPFLYVEVSDEHGINTTGNGIGHDITAILNENTKNIFLLNEYYKSHLNSYQGGIIQYPFNNLEPGHHSVEVKVWDIYNNSSSASTDFIVVKSDDLILRDLMNYPNPFSDYTNISFSHNKPGVEMDIFVDILNMNGKVVSSIKVKEEAGGYRSQNIYWDGSGARSGQSFYIYRIRVLTSDGQEAEKSGKLILAK